MGRLSKNAPCGAFLILAIHKPDSVFVARLREIRRRSFILTLDCSRVHAALPVPLLAELRRTRPCAR